MKFCYNYSKSIYRTPLKRLLLQCNLHKLMISQNDVKYAERLRGLRLDKRIKQENIFKLLGLKRQQ